MLVTLPSEEFIRNVHEIIIKQYGGKKGDLHPNSISLAVEQPKHYIYYEKCNFHTVCAVILRILATRHPFLDGNKRTALVVTIATYQFNGIELEFDQMTQKDFIDLMLWIVEKKPSIKRIAKKLEILTNKYAQKDAKQALQMAQYDFEIEQNNGK
ncbi:MAG: type II toxin-antitoxin system death-on-curing family toxin [Thiobacillus sp.]